METPGRLWGRPMRRRTLALWLTWFGVNFAYYGAFTWLPTLLVADGFGLVKSFQYTLIITVAQLPGYAVAAVLIERWGRRATLVTFLAGSAGAAIAFGLSSSVPTILLAGAALSFFNLGAWGALYAVTPEVYPTSLRATGAGSATAFGRLASILAPLLVLPLRETSAPPGSSSPLPPPSAWRWSPPGSFPNCVVASWRTEPDIPSASLHMPCELPPCALSLSRALRQAQGASLRQAQAPWT